MTAAWSALTKRWAAAALGIVAVVATGCGDDQAAFEVDDGALRGTLAVYISDYTDGHSETHYYLRDANDGERRLRFDSPPDVEPGARLKVWTLPQDDGLRVTSFEKLAPPPSATPALVAATPFAPRSFAFVLVDIGNGVNVTAETMKDRLMNSPDSIRNYYLGDSYGMQDMTAEVFGPISATLPGCENGDTSNLARNLRPMVPGTFQHYLWYFGSRTSQCDWSGLASLGTPETPSRDTWYNGSTSCVVLVQEPGHNFGMQHSSSLSCDGAPFADNPNECTASEYGDPFDPMGGGCRHMNAWQKAYQGWFGGCNGVTVTSSGTFTLNAIERACDGVQFLQIKAPKTRLFMRPAGGGGQPSTETFSYYFIELRTPYDFDGTLGNTKALAPMVLIHVADDLHTRTQRGVHTFLLDMTPNTTGRMAFSDAGLALGKTFSDPAGGLDITVQALSADGATIVVNMPGDGAGPTCLDGTAFSPPGPGVESCGTPMPTGAGGSGGGSTGTGGGPGEEPWPGSGGEGGPAPQAAANGCTCTSAGAPLASPVIATPILLLLIFLVAADRRSRRM